MRCGCGCGSRFAIGGVYATKYIGKLNWGRQLVPQEVQQSLLLVAMPFVPSDLFLLVVWPGATSSVASLLLVEMPMFLARKNLSSRSHEARGLISWKPVQISAEAINLTAVVRWGTLRAQPPVCSLS